MSSFCYPLAFYVNIRNGGKDKLNINIVCVGKMKEKFMSGAVEEYKKRLSRFANVKIIELADESAPEKMSEAEAEKVLKKEGERILEKIAPSDYVIALCVEGKQMSSEKLAEHIADCMVNGISNVTFVIGGSLGLSEEVKKRSALRLSFSLMTFPHQLMRVILLEQIYRTFKINANESYHK